MKNKFKRNWLYYIATVPLILLIYVVAFTKAFELMRTPSDLSVFGGIALLCLIMITLIFIIKLFKAKLYE